MGVEQVNHLCIAGRRDAWKTETALATAFSPCNFLTEKFQMVPKGFTAKTPLLTC